MNEAFLCDGILTAVGRYSGALSSVRTHDYGAIPINSLMERNSRVDWEALDGVTLGCANQAREDNRDVAGYQVYFLAYHKQFQVRLLTVSGVQDMTQWELRPEQSNLEISNWSLQAVLRA